MGFDEVIKVYTVDNDDAFIVIRKDDILKVSGDRDDVLRIIAPSGTIISIKGDAINAIIVREKDRW